MRRSCYLRLLHDPLELGAGVSVLLAHALDQVAHQVAGLLLRVGRPCAYSHTRHPHTHTLMSYAELYACERRTAECALAQRRD
jgi:hypothetical protein